jgi:hypothetical protein
MRRAAVLGPRALELLDGRAAHESASIEHAADCLVELVAQLREPAREVEEGDVRQDGPQ